MAEDREGTPRQRLESSEPETYVLKLFVSGSTPRSVIAIENIRRICDQHLAGHYRLQVVDVYQHPEAARSEQIIAAPTLIKQLPVPLRRFVGDLSDEASVLIGLGLQPGE